MGQVPLRSIADQPTWNICSNNVHVTRYGRTHHTYRLFGMLWCLEGKQILSYDGKTYCSSMWIIGSFGINVKEPVQSWIVHTVSLLACHPAPSCIWCHLLTFLLAIGLIIETSYFEHKCMYTSKYMHMKY